jgi:hypothetical protein
MRPHKRDLKKKKRMMNSGKQKAPALLRVYQPLANVCVLCGRNGVGAVGGHYYRHHSEKGGGSEGKKKVLRKNPLMSLSFFLLSSSSLPLCALYHLGSAQRSPFSLLGRKMFSRAVAQVARLAARPSMISRYAVAPAAPIALASEF